MTETYATWLRLGSFLSILMLMNVVECFFPKRRWNARRLPRLGGNYALVIINSLALRYLLPLTAVGAAEFAESQGWGLMHRLSIGDAANSLFTVVILDLLIYVQHVAFHRIPVFWRLHKVHHADLDIDVSTGLRFHTLEIWLSMWIKIGAVILLGANVWGVLLFEMILNGTAMFNHSNIRLPALVDRVMRTFIVTPDMHRVHHSTIPKETNSNYGFNLACWDRIFGTYIDQPQKGHLEMEIGLAEFREEPFKNPIGTMLLMPFRSSRRPSNQSTD